MNLLTYCSHALTKITSGLCLIAKESKQGVTILSLIIVKRLQVMFTIMFNCYNIIALLYVSIRQDYRLLCQKGTIKGLAWLTFPKIWKTTPNNNFY